MLYIIKSYHLSHNRDQQELCVSCVIKQSSRSKGKESHVKYSPQHHLHSTGAHPETVVPVKERRPVASTALYGQSIVRFPAPLFEKTP